jgi:hypothetical protein
MFVSRPLVSLLLCVLIPFSSVLAESTGYSITYSGGSLPNAKTGEGLRLYLDSSGVRLARKEQQVTFIPTRAITEVSYGQEVHHRIGTAAGLAVVSLGIGAIVAFSKSKKHYIGLTWSDGASRGGVALQADKNEYRGLIAALEGITGLTAVDTDSLGTVAQKNQRPQSQPQTAASYGEVEQQTVKAPGDDHMAQVATHQPEEPAKVAVASSPPTPASSASPGPARDGDLTKTIVVRFTSTPANAEVDIDGEYWGNTPTAELTRLTAGQHVIVVRKPNYQPWERKITLAPGDDRTISAELESKGPSQPRITGLD